MSPLAPRRPFSARLGLRSARLCAALGLLACGLAGCPAPSVADAPDPAPQRPFAATSVWNTRLAPDAPVARGSAAAVANLVEQVRRAGTWINSSEYSVPIYQVPAGQPTFEVRLDTPSAMYTNTADAVELSRALAAVPIPLGARPSAGTDHHLVIWQPSTDTLWELWLARRAIGLRGLEWRAAWGSRIDHVSTSDGINTHPFGATASGVSIVGGLMTGDEVRRQVIPHALALAVPDTAADRFVWPANRTDGRLTAAAAIPQGTRLRLDPDLDVDALALPPLARAMALAAQRYGIVVRDHADAVAFYAEDPNTAGRYDWGGGLDPAQVLARFPWSRLEVVDPAARKPAKRRAKCARAKTRRCA